VLLKLFILIFAAWEWTLPAGFPRPAIPADNPMNATKVELGRRLFYDARLSSNGTTSCATCHRQDLAFTDGRGRAVGTSGQFHPRGSMSLVNVAYAPTLTWADPTQESLEVQALVPMFGTSPVELDVNEKSLLAMMRNDSVYRNLVPEAFPAENNAYTLKNVTKAIAAFERTIVSMRSPYDRYRWGGEPGAISESAKRGEFLFFSSEKARCFRCHGGWNFSGGVRFDGSSAERGEGTHASYFNTGATPDTGQFKPPTLRNIAVTAPYMHDGSMKTLEDVIDHYAAGGKFATANKSEILRPLSLSEADKRDLIEFLKSLTDEELLHDGRLSDPWTKSR
jgi:cytochrome c peroxidase